MKQTRTSLWQAIASISIVTLLAGVLAGCAEKTPNEQSKGGGEASEPTEISMMNVYFSGDAPNMNNNEYIKAIEDYTNTKLDFTWVPNSAYADKFTVTLASGQLPKTLLVLNAKTPAFISAVRDGAFWEIGPYIKQFTNLSRMKQNIFDSTAIDGKIYGLFRPRPLAGIGIILRKDWLDNLGLKEPQTLEDLYQVIKAFTLNDPDKNGKNDTFGFAENNVLNGFESLLVYYGGPNKWELADGKLTPAHLTKEYVDVLKFYRRLVAEKLINPDFPLINETQKRDLIVKGKAGVTFSSMNTVTLLQDGGEKVNPAIKLDVLRTLNGPKGERARGDTGFNGLFLFPKSSVKTEAELLKILGFFDKLSDQTMQNLIEYGKEGTDYKLENGKAVKLDTARKDFPLYLPQLRVDDGSLLYEEKDLNPLDAKWKTLTAANDQIAVLNPTAPLIVDLPKTQDISKIIPDASTKYILGEIDEAAWLQAVEQWRKGGGDEQIRLMNEAYGKLHKK
ncbi:extracellular solute-binding protein [Paenibacillus solisilvae]|uniref:Extracellular solute-binding protein n=1 Tax=Paenibacillus solisilvae TaxID=2486751 RepID=A0ABW0VVT7_9BACL